MPALIRVLLLAAALWIVWRIVRSSASPRAGSRFPCASCRHCRGLFDDGALCGFGSKETFKNETHIANCMDWEQRPRR